MANVLITGAAKGIGLELTRLYLQRGDQVVATCRNSSAELLDSGARVIDNVEITDLTSLATLKTQLDNWPIDILINNAGIISNERLGELDYQRIEQQFAVNAMGPLKVTETLLSQLHEGSKVVIITSRMGSIEDNGSGGMYGYRMSKCAVSMAGKSLSIDLQPRGIAVTILHPGLVATQMTGFQGITPVESAQNLSQRIDELNLATTGQFFHANGETLPW